ncbi:MAG: aminotransferase class V-fold PLP-dependent enzyme, partial [Anaerolineae bacterium]|nr:aminotransferase class V-fold PLP-dependent enzyme [Anaerolineae bacterium]
MTTAATSQMVLDVAAIRADFPILDVRVHGKPLIYLDNAASSQKPRQVLEALDAHYRQFNANVHRGVHYLSEESTRRYEAARARVARFINARSDKEVIWTRNTTEAINLVAYSWGLTNLRPGDEVLVTEMEHHSNLVPWQIITTRTGARLRHLPVDDRGYLCLDRLSEFLTERTRLFAFTAMSNVLGTINPVAELVAAAHSVGALALVDAAQSVPHMPVDVQALNCDFLAFSGHKMCGPTGIGVLYGRQELLEEMPPFMGGGDMIREVHLDHARWN